MLKLPEPFTDGMIDDDAFLVHKYPSVEVDVEGTLQLPRKEKLHKEKESQRFQDERTSQCGHELPQKIRIVRYEGWRTPHI